MLTPRLDHHFARRDAKIATKIRRGTLVPTEHFGPTKEEPHTTLTTTTGQISTLTWAILCGQDTLADQILHLQPETADLAEHGPENIFAILFDAGKTTPVNLRISPAATALLLGKTKLAAKAHAFASHGGFSTFGSYTTWSIKSLVAELAEEGIESYTPQIATQFLNELLAYREKRAIDKSFPSIIYEAAEAQLIDYKVLAEHYTTLVQDYDLPGDIGQKLALAKIELERERLTNKTR